MRGRNLITGGWLCLATACVLTNHAVIVVAGEVEPYEARVVVARAQIRSGPGEKFYPTDTLAQGETVEVYREQGAGWLAIRPPQDSFSWVLGRHLTVRDGGLAEVNKEDVASRIGSRFGSQRNAVQVRLKKGEIVEIVGKQQMGGETWYKIAPPAGEFRWILGSQVKRIGPLETADAEPDAEPSVVAASAIDETHPEVEKAEPAASATTAPPAEPEVPHGDEWRAAPAGAASSATEVAAPPLAPIPHAPPIAEAKISAEPPPVASPASPPSPQAPATPVGPVPDELSRSLTDIELRLSRMVAAPPDRWNTERLERDTEELLAQAQTAEERQAAKDMLAKLDRFAAIGRRHQPATGRAGVGGNTGLAVAQSSPYVQSPATGQVDSGSRPTPTGSPTGAGRFDAVGTLRPVVSKRPGAPQFALVNDRGQVVSFVTPTPDVNLQPYVGRRVGIVGTRGFIPEFQRAHVTAGRVTPLSERLVR